MLAAIFVELSQDRRRAHGLTVDRNRITFFKGDFDELRLVRRILGVHRALVDIIGRHFRRIFQNLALGGGVQQVCIDREGRFAALVLGDWDLVCLSKFQQFGARGQIPLTPRRDHFDVGVQCISGQLEPHLIVALAGCTMGHRVGTGGFCDLNKTLGDQRTRNRGAQQIEALIDRIGAEHREDEIADELFADVLDKDVFRLDAQKLCFFARRLQFLALAEIGGKGDNLAAVFGLQPFQDDRSIKATGVGQHNFLGRGHGFSS